MLTPLLVALSLLLPLPADVESGPALPDRALAAVHGGRPLAAWDSLRTELLAQVAAGEWDDQLDAARAEIAALLLADVVGRLDLWPEARDALAAARPWPAATPPRVAYLLDRLYAHALSRTGDPNRAVAIIDRQGTVAEWLLVGPFDNERGSGLDVAYAPELRFARNEPIDGKERPVRWRKSPVVHHPLGLVELDELLRPNTQAIAYLATAAKPLEPGPVEVRLGTTGAYKLFVNGREVAERRVERPLASDQDRVVVELGAGWNQILLKTAVEEGPWAVQVRLTDLDGRPLRSIELESALLGWPGPPPHPDVIPWWDIDLPEWEPLAEDVYAEAPQWGPAGSATEDAGADAAAGPAPEAVTPGLTAVREAREILEARPDDPEAARLLTVYHLMVHPDDSVDRTARLVAERATELAPDDVEALYLLARAHEVDRASRDEVEVNRRLHVLQRVLELDPDHMAALLDLAEFSSADSPVPARAEELTARAVRVNPESFDALISRANILEWRQRSAEARALLQVALATPEAETRRLAAAMRAGHLREQGRMEAFRAELEKAFERNRAGSGLIDWLIADLVDHGDTERALYVTEHALLVDPGAVERMRSTAHRLEYLGDIPQHRARELITRALDVCPEHTGALADLVRIDLRLGRTAEAVETLGRLIELDPGNDDARRHLALLTAEERERFEQPYRWDATELVDLPFPETDGNDPLEVLARTVVWRVHPDGTEHSYEHLVLRPLNLGGIKALDRIPIQAGGGASLQVMNVRVIRTDGSIEHAPAPLSSRRDMRWYDLPPLQVGDVVDVEYRVDQREPDVFGEYFGTRHEFYPDRIDGLAPTRRSELVVIAPPDVPLYAAARNAEGLEHSVTEDTDGNTVWRWVARDLPRPPMETAMPGRGEIAPVVDVTTFESWEAFADWWWHFIEKEFVTTPEMVAKVAELTAGLETEHEKVQAIARFVGQEIRYNTWPFGTHGYEPYSAATIFERRFGDCKDKSILLRQLLAEIDVEAIPVLIKAEYARADEPLDAAMVGLFNHCIAYLPPTDERDGYYLDATADRNPIEYLRADDQGARVLHVASDGGTLHDIPYAPPEENALRRRYDVALDERGSARVELQDESNGFYGVRLRYRFGGEQGDIGELVARQLDEGFGKVTVVAVETSDLDDIAQAARLSATFDAADVWGTEGELRSLPVSFDDVGLLGAAKESAADRTFDLVLDRPFAQETTIRYRLPEGASVQFVPEPVVIEAPGLLDYSLSVERTDDGLLVTRRFHLHERRIEPPDYGVFRDALRDVDRAEKLNIRLTPPPGSSP